jgi:hypothetical protein
VGKDITPILAGWDYDPAEMQVRIIRGEDQLDKIQVRMDLGLIQMELQGRPDGSRPNGAESLLDWYEAEARRVDATGGELGLDSDACAALMREGFQYYQRYIALFHLERFDLVARDTERNLRLFAFVKRHAVRMSDRLQFDQYRPYVTMMLTRARGMLALQKNDHAAALKIIDNGIQAIRAFLVEYDQLEHAAECKELKILLEWREQIETHRPIGPLERMEQQLELAIAREQYEEAARIRDQLRKLRGDPPSPPPTSTA